MSILAGVLAKMDVLHPYALAMGSGIGSASMMAASVSPIIDAYPDLAEGISAYATSANLLSGVMGIYIYIFFSLPLASKMYDVLAKLRKTN